MVTLVKKQAQNTYDMTFISNIYNTLRNMTLNSLGVERDLTKLLADKDIGKVRDLMQNRDTTVLDTLKEFLPAEHKIHLKQDKQREGKAPYRSEKLPRARQRYINEVELFFLLGNNIKWEVGDATKNGDRFSMYQSMLTKLRFDSIIRQAKRLAGAETESAILFHLYRTADGQPAAKPIVLAYSKGYTLRPLFDQYGNMLAFGYGYYLNEGNKNVEHFDIQTPGVIYKAKKGISGWEVEAQPNPTDKINAVYIQQPKAWDGVQERCDREESIDSRVADTNNYFSDPMAVATADVVNGLAGTDKPGKLIQLRGPDSKFEYINPPMASDLQAAERKALNDSILFDSFTPDLSYEAMKGVGTLSGEAMKRAMALGYMKRANLEETYDVVVDRCKNIILAIMEKVTHIGQFTAKDLEITHSFAEPFNDDVDKLWSQVGRAYADGILSLEQAVQMLGATDDVEAEIARIKEAKAQAQAAALFEPTY